MRRGQKLNVKKAASNTVSEEAQKSDYRREMPRLIGRAETGGVVSGFRFLVSGKL